MSFTGLSEVTKWKKISFFGDHPLSQYSKKILLIEKKIRFFGSLPDVTKWKASLQIFIFETGGHIFETLVPPSINQAQCTDCIAVTILTILMTFAD